MIEGPETKRGREREREGEREARLRIYLFEARLRIVYISSNMSSVWFPN